METFLKSTAGVHRVPASAIYMTATTEGMPPSLLHNLKHNMFLHARVLLVTVETALTSTIDEADRLTETRHGGGFTRVVVRYGFAETPDVPKALAPLMARLPDFNPETAAYFISRQTLIPSSRPGMALWREKLFAAMVRNSESPMTFFKLPVDRVVELGSQVEI